MDFNQSNKNLLENKRLKTSNLNSLIINYKFINMKKWILNKKNK